MSMRQRHVSGDGSNDDGKNSVDDEKLKLQQAIAAYERMPFSLGEGLEIPVCLFDGVCNMCNGIYVCVSVCVCVCVYMCVSVCQWA
jgi:hypothetical protein